MTNFTKKYLAPLTMTTLLVFGLGNTACSSPETKTIDGREFTVDRNGNLTDEDGTLYFKDERVARTTFRYSSILSLTDYYVCDEDEKEFWEDATRGDEGTTVHLLNPEISGKCEDGTIKPGELYVEKGED